MLPVGHLLWLVITYENSAPGIQPLFFTALRIVDFMAHDPVDGWHCESIPVPELMLNCCDQDGVKVKPIP